MTGKTEVCECGKKRYEWQEVCWACKEDKEVKDIWGYSKEKGEITNEKYVICPYCGEHYGEDDLNESTDLDCDGCGKTFLLEVDYDVSYSTYKNENEEPVVKDISKEK